MTFLKKLRDAAMKCSNPDYRGVLRAAADNLDWAIRDFTIAPTDETLAYLQGRWSYALRVLKETPPEADPQPPLAPAVAEPMRKAA